MSVPHRPWGLIKLRTKTTVSRTTLIMPSANGGHRAIDSVLDLALGESLLSGFVPNRREVCVQRLQRPRFRGFPQMNGSNAQLPLVKGDLEQAVILDAQLAAELRRNRDLTASQRPNQFRSGLVCRQRPLRSAIL